MNVPIRVACDYTSQGFGEAWRAWEEKIPGLRIDDAHCAHGDVAGAVLRGDVGGASGFHFAVLQLPDKAGVAENGASGDLEVTGSSGNEAHTRFVDALGHAVRMAQRFKTTSAVLLTDAPRDVAHRPDLKQRRAKETAAERLARVRSEAGCVIARIPRRGAVVLTPKGLQMLYPFNTRDIFMDPGVREATAVLYKPSHYARLAAAMLRRALHAHLKDFAKVFFVDCDHTIWDGVAAEATDIPSHIKPVKRLQERLKVLGRSGRLICLLSKNTLSDVECIFDTHPAMLLRREDIASFSGVNWGLKSENLRRVCRSLNLSPDNAVFLDDNPAEIAEMRGSCPEVLSIHITEAGRKQALKHCWLFDVHGEHVTEDDAKRSASYRSNAQRDALLSQHLGDGSAPPPSSQAEVQEAADEGDGTVRLAAYKAFLESLGLCITTALLLPNTDPLRPDAMQTVADTEAAVPGGVAPPGGLRCVPFAALFPTPAGVPVVAAAGCAVAGQRPAQGPAPRPEEGAADAACARAAQLTVRTNQFNSNPGMRLQPDELAGYLAGARCPPAGCESRRGVLSVSVKDSFGDYGTVAVALFRIEGAAEGGAVLHVDQICMSCRVMNRGVEHAILCQLAEACLQVGRAAPPGAATARPVHAGPAAPLKKRRVGVPDAAATAGEGSDADTQCLVRVPVVRTAKNLPLRSFMRKVDRWHAEQQQGEQDGQGNRGAEAEAAAPEGQTHGGCFDAAILSQLCFESTFEAAREGGEDAEGGDAAASTTPAADTPRPKEAVLREIVAAALEAGDTPIGGGGSAAAASSQSLQGFEAFFTTLLQRVAPGGFDPASQMGTRILDLGIGSMQVVQIMQEVSQFSMRCRPAHSLTPGGTADPALLLSNPTVAEIIQSHATGAGSSAVPDVTPPPAGATAPPPESILPGLAAALSPLLHPQAPVGSFVFDAADPALDRPLADFASFDEVVLPELLDLAEGYANQAYRQHCGGAAGAGAPITLPAHWQVPAASALLTPRRMAAEMCRLMKKRGASQQGVVDFESPSDPRSALHAAKEGRLAFFESLAGSAAACSEDGGLRRHLSRRVDRQGLDALAWAAGMGHSHVVGWCLRVASMDPNSASRSGRTPLMWACRNGHLGTARLLLECGADVLQRDAKGNSCLHWAIWGGSAPVAGFLIEEHGLSVGDVNGSGCCGAIWAATAGGVAFCEWVLSRGGDFARLNHWGHGCVVKAAWRGNVALLRWLLLEARLVPPQHILFTDVDGKTPVDLARGRGHVEVVCLLEGIAAQHPDVSRKPAPSIQEAGKAGPVEY